jgi:regulator of sigma E protease
MESLALPVQSFISILAAAGDAQPWYYGFLFKLIPFAIVLGLLIFVHEVGHFLAAKFFGVKVERFSFGLGPRLVGIKVGDTDYRISAFPLGGYVKMVGEGLDDEVAEAEKERSFSHKAVWKRMIIVFSGPLFNLIFAVIVFVVGFLMVGQVILTSEIGDVKPGFPAHQAGLRQGDRIVKMAGRPISTWKELPEVVRNSPGKPISIIFVREGNQYSTVVTPITSTVKNIFGEDVQESVIGVTPSGNFINKELGLSESFQAGIFQAWGISKMTLVSLIKLIQRKVPLETLGGPIFIAQLAGQQAQEGWINLLFFTALLSINLAILNLLPIPILDGGHLIFFAMEWIIGKPLSLKKREVAQQVGMFILILLMVFVFYNDIIRLLH